MDTPTVCNALEVVDQSRRTRGFNVRPFVCPHPELPSVVGYTRTARIRATHEPEKPMDVEGYYTYIAENGPLPSVLVIQDLDEIPGKLFFPKISNFCKQKGEISLETK